MIEGRAYYLTFSLVQRGSFQIHELDHEPHEDESIELGPDTVRYIADGPLAGDLAAKGVILFLWEQDKIVGIAYHPDDREMIFRKD